MSINSVKKSGTTLTMVIIFENLTKEVLRIGMAGSAENPDYTHLLDEIGERWEPRGSPPDTAKIFSYWGEGVDLAPGAKRRTTINFITKETGGGTIFTLIMHEVRPKSQKHSIHNIRLDQK